MIDIIIVVGSAIICFMILMGTRAIKKELKAVSDDLKEIDEIIKRASK